MSTRPASTRNFVCHSTNPYLVLCLSAANDEVLNEFAYDLYQSAISSNSSRSHVIVGYASQ